MNWRSHLLWSNFSPLKLEFQLENLEAPSEDPILQSQTTGVGNQWFRVILLSIQPEISTIYLKIEQTSPFELSK